jgi:hypothetical protein
MYQLLESVLTSKVHNGATAGTTLQTTSATDTAGYDGIVFIADFAGVTDGSVITLTPLTATVSTTSGGTAVSNATNAAFTASTSSNSIIACDVIKPANRYVYATVGRTTQNAVLNTVIAQLYRARNLPVAYTSGTNTGVQAVTLGGAI